MVWGLSAFCIVHSAVSVTIWEKSSLLQVKVADTEAVKVATWDDSTQPTCDRCGAHAVYAGFLKTSSACPGCDCGHGLQLCGCASCENTPVPLKWDVVLTATWDNPKRPTCDRCAAHAAFMGFMESKNACPDCDCGNGIELCGCAHCDNPPLSLMSDVADDVEVEVTATWDDPAKPTCDRCGAHAAYAGFLETSSACPGCDCGHGLKLCGCASCDNLPLSLVSDVVVAATWDDPKKPACDRCAAHAALMGFMESKHACPDCDCGHGIELCGCAHCRNSPLSLMSHVVDDVAVEVTATWDDPAKPTCDRCGAHAAFAGFRETSSACPGCDCGNGLQLCGCSDCDNLPLSLVSDVVVAATWDDPTMPVCDRCAAHAAFMGFAGTSHACPKCDCGNDIELCGCAHCFNPPTAFARVELDHGAVIVGDSAADKSW